MNKEVHYFPGEICSQFLRAIWIKNSYAAFAKSSICCLSILHKLHFSRGKFKKQSFL